MKEEQTLKRRSLRGTGRPASEIMKMPALAFLITALSFFILVLLSQKYPFGKYTTVISDLSAQYAPYLYLLKYKLTHIDFSNFINNTGYSFLLGAGKNLAGTFGYYMASPLNLLVLLFPAKCANEFILCLMCIKISLASAFMCAFIEERAVKKGTRWPVIWGVMYAFSSYTMLFLFHIMWLDGYMLLPLLLLYIERYLQNGKLRKVTVVLFLLFLSNYYIAYMAGIYSFLYLLGRMYLMGKFGKENQPLKIIGRFVLRAVLAASTLGVILIPVGLDTIRNGDPTHSAIESNYVGFTFVSFIDRIFLGYSGEFNEVLIANMPLVFVSVLVTLLCTVFFVSRVFPAKIKKFYAVIFVIIYLMLNIDLLDVAWQVFDSPNWFWHRESFVFITLFLTVSYMVFEKISEIGKEEILKSAGILMVLLLIAQSFGDMKSNGKLFLFNAAFIAVFTLLLLGLKKTDWKGQFKNTGKIVPVVLAVIAVYEVALTAPMQSSGTSTLSLSSGEGEDFVDDMWYFEDYSEASRLMGLGFRSEYDEFMLDDAVAVNGASQYAGFRGISLFNSNSNKRFGRFLKQLGYAVNYNYFSAEHSYSAPATDAFFSIGTVYSTDPTYANADLVVKNEELSFYTAGQVMPIAFNVSDDAGDFDFYSLETDVNDKDYFAFQNDWYRSMFDEFTEDFYVPVEERYIDEELLNGTSINLGDYQNIGSEPEDEITSEQEDTEVFDPDDLGLEVVSDYYDTQTDIYRNNDSLPIILNYDIEITRQDELYMNISVPRMNSGCEVYLNGDIMASYSSGTFYSSILRLGSYDPGDTVRVTIMSDNDAWTYLNVRFAYFDKESYGSQFDGLDLTFDTVMAEDGVVDIRGTLKEGEMILTSIPYEDGWTAYVDGVKTEITPYEDALISIHAAPGEHDVSLRFTPPGLKAGAALTIAGIIGLAAIELVENKNKR